MKKYAFLTASIILALTSPGICAESPSVAAIERPNILWIYLEDVSRWFGCYGDKLAETPNIDRLAKTGVRFDRFYTCAGVCSAMRSGTVT